MFEKFIRIDYSGRGTPVTRTPGLQAYVATNDRLPKRVNPPSTPAGRNRNWCRKEVAAWLIEQPKSGKGFIAGLDFSFFLPLPCFQRYGLSNWDEFLADFVEHWPTDQHDAYAIAQWLRVRSLDDHHLDPAMTGRDREAAELGTIPTSSRLNTIPIGFGNLSTKRKTLKMTRNRPRSQSARLLTTALTTRRPRRSWRGSSMKRERTQSSNAG